MSRPFQGQKVKGQGHQAALLSAALTRKAAATVSVGTYSAWESTATLRLLGGAQAFGAHVEGEEQGYNVSPRAQLVQNRLQFGFFIGFDEPGPCWTCVVQLSNKWCCCLRDVA